MGILLIWSTINRLQKGSNDHCHTILFLNPLDTGCHLWVLLSCSAIIYLLRQRRDTSLLKEIHLRVWSWWRIAIGVAVVIAGPPWMGALLIAYISFVAMREMFSIGQLRGADRAGIFAAYLAIPGPVLPGLAFLF